MPIVTPGTVTVQSFHSLIKYKDWWCLFSGIEGVILYLTDIYSRMQIVLLVAAVATAAAEFQWKYWWWTLVPLLPTPSRPLDRTEVTGTYLPPYQ